MSNPPPPDPTRPFPPDEPPSVDPWAAPSGDGSAPQPPPPQPPQYQPGHAPLPQQNPPTAQFPATPPQGYPAPGYETGYQQSGYQQQGYPQQASGPTGYGQASGPPGYGPPPGGPPPGYGQPHPGYGAPQPPRKRNNTPLIAVLIAVTLLLCAGGVTSVVLLVNRAGEKAQETIDSLPTIPPDIDVPALPTDLPTLPTDLPDVPGNEAGEEVEVEYEITGDGPVSIVYLDGTEGGPKQENNVKLPWRKEITMQGAYIVSVVAVRAGLDEGTISCSASVDGDEVAQKSSTGRFATASCTKTVY